VSAKLNNQHLRNLTTRIIIKITVRNILRTCLRSGSGYPYAVINGIGENALEYVALAVNFARVNFIEEGHHHEGVEYDGEVL
jgi:hypothetical protein